MIERHQELFAQVLSKLNFGPNDEIPIKLIMLTMNTTKHAELFEALKWAESEGLITFKAGSISGLGAVILTEAGYKYKKSITL